MDKPQSSLPCRYIVYRWGRTRSWAEIKVKHTDRRLVRYSDISTSLVSFHLLSTNSVAFYTIASCSMLRYDVIYYFRAVWSVFRQKRIHMLRLSKDWVESTTLCCRCWVDITKSGRKQRFQFTFFIHSIALHPMSFLHSGYSKDDILLRA